MFTRQLQRVVAAAAAVVLTVVGLLAQGGPSKRDADLLHDKLAAIERFGEARTGEPHSTSITEGEANAYLKFDASPHLPAGVVDPSVAMPGTGRLTGRAFVDLDVLKQRRGARPGFFDPMSFLSGRVEVTATGVLKTSEGVGQFLVDSASVGSLPIPKSLLQEIVSSYSRTAENPAGINLDDTFMLPARIREIRVERGQAVVVQ
jgi:hypothetical protein